MLRTLQINVIVKHPKEIILQAFNQIFYFFFAFERCFNLISLFNHQSQRYGQVVKDKTSSCPGHKWELQWSLHRSSILKASWSSEAVLLVGPAVGNDPFYYYYYCFVAGQCLKIWIKYQFTSSILYSFSICLSPMIAI